MEQFKTSLVISTYNWPEALELCLKSSLRQTVAPAEILVADDGSDERTAQLIARYRVQTSIPIVHVWQEDTGFRVGSIRNKAIARATGAYIIQVDGDVILHPDFVRDHVSVARPGRFVSGSRVLLGPRYSAGLLANRSIDTHPAYALRRLGGDLPFGCHSWTKRRMRRAWRGIIPAAK